MRSKGQNTSSAVMQQRREPHDSLDYFPTQPWATRALCEALMKRYGPLSQLTAWEPACGEGHMSHPLAEYFASVFASDVHDYTDTFPDQDDVCDFLTCWDHPWEFIESREGSHDWIITNPPFRLAEEFIFTALRRAKIGVAVFVRTSFLESKARYENLYRVHRPALILQFAERVPLVKGRIDKDASTATSYCWIIFLKAGVEVTEFDFIPPCRKRLEKPGDYSKTETIIEPAPLLTWIEDAEKEGRA